MGRININTLKYMYNRFYEQLKNQIPYKYRKPFVILSNILGFIIYFKMILSITNSKYLLFISNFMKSIGTSFQEVENPELLIFVIILSLILLISKSYGYKKQNPSVSLYKHIKSIITLGYIIITILGILPWVI